jgi:hypothetical protein
MLQLSAFTTADRPPSVSISMSSLRVVGGSLQIESHTDEIVTYSRGRWEYRGHSYPLLTVTGGACLEFGMAREPTVICDPIDHFYFAGPILSTDGVAIAKYNEHQHTWQGILRPMWWVSMRMLAVVADSRFNRGGLLPLPQKVKTASSGTILLTDGDSSQLRETGDVSCAAICRGIRYE